MEAEGCGEARIVPELVLDGPSLNLALNLFKTGYQLSFVDFSGA
jgi:hypothetical protein